MSLFAELKRRNVFRVGIAYGIATWALLQITDVISPILDLPDWAQKLFFVILAIGFVPALIFAWAFDLTPEGIKKEKDVDRSVSITNVTGRKLNYIIIGVLFLAVTLLLFDRYSGQPELDEQQVVEKSIAVLPFVNMSSDAEQEFFSDGITEEILNALAAVKGLKVAGRTSSFAFKGQNDDLRRIGDTLDEAIYLALAGQNESAITRLEAAFERGMLTAAPIAKAFPQFALLGDDPRLVTLESAMIGKTNAEREILGLEPRDPYTEFWQ